MRLPPALRRVVFVLAIAVALIGAGGPLVRAQYGAALSSDIVAFLAANPGQPAQILVSGNVPEVLAATSRHGVPVVRVLDQVVVVRVTPAQIARLQRETVISSMSGDLPIAADMKVSDQSMASNQARAGTAGLLLGIGGYAAVTGKGVGVAIVDSGIGSSHKALYNKVIAAVSFVPNDPSVDDKFGHGTHIAGIIAGQASAASGVTTLYSGGVAPGANLINVRVLGKDGTGRTSDVIAGIDWVVNNQSKYGIRVLNVSLGHTVTEPSITDPLCAAVSRAAAAGLVVVASAGNNGKTATGQRILGGISSPGNSPDALTVGALNTWATVKRTDDTVTTYSSRGPTRYEFAVKPDVVAPGNKIVSLEAPNGSLAKSYPTLHVAGSGTNAYYRMSGTSMAAAMMSGAAALMLEAVPTATPRHVKLALQSTATYMVDGGLMAAGTGSADVWAARRTVNGTGLLDLPLSTIAGLTVKGSGASFWDRGTLTGRLYKGLGIRLISLLDLGRILGNPSLLSFGDLNLIGLLNPLASMAPNPLIWGEVSYWTSSNQIIWGEQIYDPSGQQIIWGESDYTEGYQIIWGESTFDDDGDPSHH